MESPLEHFVELVTTNVHLLLSCSPPFETVPLLPSLQAGLAGGQLGNLTSQPLMPWQAKPGIPLSRSRSGLSQGPARRNRISKGAGRGSSACSGVLIPLQLESQFNPLWNGHNNSPYCPTVAVKCSEQCKHRISVKRTGGWDPQGRRQDP